MDERPYSRVVLERGFFFNLLANSSICDISHGAQGAESVSFCFDSNVDDKLYNDKFLVNGAKNVIRLEFSKGAV